MDIVALAPSRIVAVARAAYARPDTEFLCFGESDRPGPVGATAALNAALARGDARYPDVRGVPALRQALAAMLTGLHALPVTEDRVQVTGSGMTAVSVALAAVVRAGDRVVLHTPAWPNPGNATLLRGASVDALPLAALPDGRFHLDLDRLAAKLRGARAMVLNSPNNPTGWTATRAELTAILDLCRTYRVWLISDEVYSRLVYDGIEAAPSLLDIAMPDDWVMVCNSFSKAWAMTGWRLGWITAPVALMAALGKLSKFNVSCSPPFIQAAGIVALEQGEAFVAATALRYRQMRDLACARLGAIPGVSVPVPGGAMYCFFAVSGCNDSVALARALLHQARVGLAPGRAFGATGEGCLRLCFAVGRDRLEEACARIADHLTQSDVIRSGHG